MARAYASIILKAPVETVWSIVRDFNGLPNWHPAIAESRIEGGEPADKIGCVRDFTLRNGDRIREKLLRGAAIRFRNRVRVHAETGGKHLRQHY